MVDINIGRPHLMAALCIENNRKTRGIKVDVAGWIYKGSKAPIRNNKGI